MIRPPSVTVVYSKSAPTTLTTCCYHQWKPLARGVRVGAGGRGVVKARQVIPLQARQDWNSDLPAGCALHCNVEAVEDGGGCALELWWMCSSDRWKGLRLSLNPSPAYKPILLLVTLLQFPLSFLRLEVAQKRESLVA